MPHASPAVPRHKPGRGSEGWSRSLPMVASWPTSWAADCGCDPSTSFNRHHSSGPEKGRRILSSRPTASGSATTRVVSCEESRSRAVRRSRWPMWRFRGARPGSQTARSSSASDSRGSGVCRALAESPNRSFRWMMVARRNTRTARTCSRTANGCSSRCAPLRPGRPAGPRTRPSFNQWQPVSDGC